MGKPSQENANNTPPFGLDPTSWPDHPGNGSTEKGKKDKNADTGQEPFVDPAPVDDTGATEPAETADSAPAGRELTFDIEGEPGATVNVREVDGGKLEFTVTVDPDSESTGDLRGLFFHLADEALVDGLSVEGDDVTDSAFDANGVSGVGNGANVKGREGPFDIGVEIGTQGMSQDDIQTTTFTLAHETDALSLDLIAEQVFAVRMTSVGSEGESEDIGEEDGGREDSLKLVGMAPAIEDNASPEAKPDIVETDEDTVLTGNVLADNGNGEDSDPDGDQLEVATAPVVGPQHGTLVLNADGSFVYTPDEDWFGEDSFSYLVSDGHGGEDTAAVSITVNPINDDPVAEDDFLTIIEDEEFGYEGSLDLVTNDHDVDNGNNELFITEINGSAIAPGGFVVIGVLASVFLEGDGRTVFYSDPELEGPLDFEYTISDGMGVTATGAVDVGFADDALLT